MFTFPSDINPALIEKFSNGDALRANEYIELYFFYKSTQQHLEALGPKFGLALESVIQSLESITQCLKDRSLFEYCIEVFDIMVKPTDVMSNIGVGFVLLNESTNKNMDAFGQKLKALSYVKEINHTIINNRNAFYVSYSKSEVPENEAFSTNITSLEEVNSVKKVV